MREHGNPERYAALASLAFERANRVGERGWAKLGADAGQTWCMYRHAVHLAMGADGDQPTLRRAVAYAEQAGNRGDADAMLLVGNLLDQLGDSGAARAWYDRARATGNPDVLATLAKYGTDPPSGGTPALRAERGAVLEGELRTNPPGRGVARAASI